MGGGLRELFSILFRKSFKSLTDVFCFSSDNDMRLGLTLLLTGTLVLSVNKNEVSGTEGVKKSFISFDFSPGMVGIEGVGMRVGVGSTKGAGGGRETFGIEVFSPEMTGNGSNETGVVLMGSGKSISMSFGSTAGVEG